MTAAAFLEALRDDPGDDLTRLVFADWLEDRGETDRAEFIRVAVELEALPESDPARGRLLARYNELRLSRHAGWLGQVPASLEDVGLRGGVVTRLAFRPDAPAADIEAMLARHPAHELSIAGEHTIRELARSPALGRVRSLVVRQGLRKRQARLLDRLLDSPRLLGLRELALAGDCVDSYLARVLADSVVLRGLTSLRLERTQVHDEGVKALLHPEALPALRHWHVECGLAYSNSLKRLFLPTNAPRWQSLHWPALRWCGTEHLAGLGGCVNLRKLSVEGPAGGCEARAWLPPLAELRELRLGGHVSFDDADALAAWPGLARLRSLLIEPNYLVAAASRGSMRYILRSSPHFKPAMKFELPA